MRHPNQVRPVGGSASAVGRSGEFNAYLARQTPERRHELLLLEHAYVRERSQNNDPSQGILEETLRGYEDAPAGSRPYTPDI
jgi:hypothetical protein